MQSLLHPVRALQLAMLLILVFASLRAATASGEKSDPHRRRYDIPAGPAVETLKSFTRQSSVEVLFPASQVSQLHTRAVAGTYTAFEALELLVEGTPFRAFRDEQSGALGLKKTDGALPPRPPEKNAKGRSRPGAEAQTTPASDETILLNVFEVVAEEEDSYGATRTNSVTRFSTDLEKLPVSAEVLSEKFMKDMAETNMDILVSTFAASSGFAAMSEDSEALPIQPGSRTPNSEVRIRGIGSGGGVRRDGMIGYNNSSNVDGFAVERIEILKGPNALLYAGASGGGVIAAISKQARFGAKALAELSFRTDQYGSRRGSVDFGRSYRTGLKLVPEVAVRGTFMAEDTYFYRDGFNRHGFGGYAQIALKVPFSTLRLQYQGSQFTNAVGLLPGFDYRYNKPSSTFVGWNPSPEMVARHRGPDGAMPYFGLNDLLIEGEAQNVVGGRLNYRNIAGALVVDNNHYPRDSFWSANFESRWNRVFSSLLTFAYNLNNVDMNWTAQGNLIAPGYNPNKWVGLDTAKGGTSTGYARTVVTDWTVVSNAPELYEQRYARTVARAAIAAEWDMFGKRMQNQAVAGFERNTLDATFDWSYYYLADENWNVVRNPATINTNTLGRYMLNNIWTPVADGPAILAKPDAVRARRVTIDGFNFVLQSNNYEGVVTPTPENPRGLYYPGGQRGREESGNRNEGLFVAMNSSFFQDAVNTLVGFRSDDTRNYLWDYRQPTERRNSASKQSKNIGVNVRLLSWLRGYVNWSSASQPPQANALMDAYGRPLKYSDSEGSEAGLKFWLLNNRLSGSIAVYQADVKNELSNASSPSTYANPDGINGRHGATDTWLNVDRTSSGVEFVLSGNPTRNLRTLFKAAKSDGRYGTDLSFDQLNNDEININSSGVVTYTDGTPLMVNPNSVQASTGATAVPLTLAMLNDRNSPYYWDPNPNNATTQNTTLRDLLRASDRVHGRAATGRTGLAANTRQVDWDDPYGFNGTYVYGRAGRKTIGYPEYRFSLMNTYTFDTGALKGFSVGGLLQYDVNYRSRWVRWPISFDSKNRIVLNTDRVKGAEMPRVSGIPGRFYYTDQGLLWGLPNRFNVNAWLGYSRKVWRGMLWSVQLNIDNLLDDTRILPVPYSGNVYGETRGWTRTAEPRRWTLTNSIGF